LRLSQQSDMFSEQILPGFHGGVKTPCPGVGKHLFAARAKPRQNFRYLSAEIN
jgi:hypothetical protein